MTVHEQEWRTPVSGLSVYLDEIRPGSITNFNRLSHAVEGHTQGVSELAQKFTKALIISSTFRQNIYIDKIPTFNCDGKYVHVQLKNFV
jgi:hypothetical protein